MADNQTTPDKLSVLITTTPDGMTNVRITAPPIASKSGVDHDW